MYLSKKAEKIIYSDETRSMMREYNKLSGGRHFPPFNYDEWPSVDSWFSALRAAVEELQTPKSTE